MFVECSGDFIYLDKTEEISGASFLSASLALLISLYILIAGFRSWDSGRKIIGAFLLVIGILLDFNGTFGFVLGVDFWSLWHRL